MSEVPKIIIADESPFFRSIERQFLQNAPAEIAEVADSETLLALVEQAPPALIYLSCSLPPRSGIDCCVQIKAQERFADVPVIMICDRGRADQEERCRQISCDEILVKPLDRHQFLEAGRRFLNVIREHRRSCMIQIDVVCKGETFKGKGLDINSGGVFIDCKQEVTVGDLVDLTFNVPGSVSSLPVACKGLVTWLNRRPSPLKPHYPSGFGVKFVGLPGALAERLGKLVETLRG